MDPDDQYEWEEPGNVEAMISEVSNRLDVLSGTLQVEFVYKLIRHRIKGQNLSSLLSMLDGLSRCDFLSLLPLELGQKVLEWLDLETLVKCLLVCKAWTKIVFSHEKLWISLTEELGEPRIFKRHKIHSPLASFDCHQYLLRINEARRLDAMWNRGTPRKITISGHSNGMITQLKLLPSDRVVSASDDGTLKLWCTQNGKLLASFMGHSGGVWTMDVSEPYLVSGSTDRTLRLWNINTGTLLGIFKGHVSTVRCVSFCHGSASLPAVVSGSRDQTVRIWDLTTKATKHLLLGHSSSVRCLAVYGTLIASGSYDGTARLWDAETGTCQKVFHGHTGKIYSILFVQEGQILVTGGMDSTIHCWDTAAGDCMAILEGHRGIVGTLCPFDKDCIISSSTDGSIRIWRLNWSGQAQVDAECLHRLKPESNSAVNCMQVGHNRLVTGSDRACGLWDPNKGIFIRDLVSDVDIVWRISLDDAVCVVGYQCDGASVISIFRFDGC